MRWHRSSIFWVGLLMLACMAGSWVDSLYHSSGGTIVLPGGWQYGGGQLKGHLRLEFFGESPSDPKFSFGRVEIAGRSFAGPEHVGFYHWESHDPFHGLPTPKPWILYIAWWVPMAAFLLLWIPLLVWSYRRYIKRQAGPELPVAVPD